MPDAPRSRLSLYLDLIRWDRPAGWLLPLWPALTALWLAAGGFPGWHLLIVFILGTFLMRSAGCCVNDVADRDFDLHVKRTAQRPVTSGRVSPKEALAVGAVLALLAFALVLTTNWPTIALSFGTLAVAIAYPFAKRVISMPQAVLGVAFSFGVPMAFTAVHGRFDVLTWPVVWLLWASQLLWVLAYDTEYAMVDRDDDLKIGMKTSAITLGRWDVAAVMGFYALSLLLWCMALWPVIATASGAKIAIILIAIFAALAQVLWHYKLIRGRTREGCFKAFRLNHWLGFTLFVGVVVSGVAGV